MFVTCRLKIWTLLETMNLSWPMAITLVNELLLSGPNVVPFDLKIMYMLQH